MIAAGEYKARAVSANMGKSQQKGTPCVTVLLELLDGPDAGKTIEWVGWVTETTKVRTAESLEVLGFDGADLSTVRGEAVAVIEHEEYTRANGEMALRPRVKWINSPNRGGAKFDALSSAESARVMGELKGLVLASRQARGNGQASAPKAPGPKF